MTNIEDINGVIKGVCNDLLEGKRIEGFLIEAIILTGSFVHKQIHDKSDIDIFVVVENKIEYIRHIAYYKGEKLIQLRICSYDKFVENCLSYERKRPAAYACRVLYDRNGQCMKAIDESKRFLEWGPKIMEPQLQEKLKNTIKNEMSTLDGLIFAENYLSALLLINDLICMNIDYYNNKNGYWMTNSNYLFSELKNHNEEIYSLVKSIILDSDIDMKVRNLNELCHLVIEDYEELTGEYVYDEFI